MVGLMWLLRKTPPTVEAVRGIVSSFFMALATEAMPQKTMGIITALVAAESGTFMCRG
jgi:hypothetical protein